MKSNAVFSNFLCTRSQSGPDERSIPGNTIAVNAEMPFNGLTTFGGAFLSKFECSQIPHSVSYKSRSRNILIVTIVNSSAPLAYDLFSYELAASRTHHLCGHSRGPIWRKAKNTKKL